MTNIMAATTATSQVLLSQQLGTTEAALYTAPASTTAVIAQGSLCNVTASLPAPTLTLGTTATTGGTLAAGTFYWKVAAVTAAGETLGSNEVSATTTGTTSSQPLSWSAVPGAVSYNVYRGTTAGGESIYFSTTATSYTDTGAAGTTKSPVATQTTATGVTVFLSIVKAGGTLGDGTHRVVNNYMLAANDTLPLKDFLGGAMLGPGDIIAGYATSPAAVDVVLTGTVLS